MPQDEKRNKTFTRDMRKAIDLGAVNPPDAKSIYEFADPETNSRRVMAAINSLPAQLRHAITLFYMYQLSYAEIATQLDLSAGTVKARVYRARQKLKDILLKDNLADLEECAEAAEEETTWDDEPPGEEMALAAMPEGESHAHPHRILVIEDNDRYREWLVGVLASPDRQIDYARNGMRARELFIRNEYSLIFVDLRLPDTTGHALIKDIRRLARPVTIIVLTADGSLDAAVKALEHGADDYLLKSSGATRLQGLVERALEGGLIDDEGEPLRLRPAIGRDEPNLTELPSHFIETIKGVLKFRFNSLDQAESARLPDHIQKENERVLEALSLIPANLRKVIELVLGQGLEFKKASRVIGVSEEYFANLYYMALVKVREFLDKRSLIDDDGERVEPRPEPSRLPPPPEPPPRKPSRPEDTRAEKLDALLATVPKDAPYAEQAARCEGLIGEVRQGVAARLLPALKDEMKARPHGTYEEKVELVRWVNGELRRFDLAFRNPKTGEAASFKPFTGHHPEIGSFQLVSKDAEGRDKTFTTPDLETLLAKLELMDAPPRREALAEWQAKVGHGRRGAKRG